MQKNGLTETELSELLRLGGKKFSQLGFQQIVSYLYDGFSQSPGGKWTFSHRLYKEAVLSSARNEDVKRLYDILVLYSETSSEFMKEEGFYYILNSQSDTVSRVLENAPSWETCDEVYNEVGCLARDSEEFRGFLTELAKKYPSEGMAEFWLAFQDFVYGNDVEEMTLEIIKNLSEADCVKNHRYELILRSISMGKREEALSQTEKALLCAEEFSKEERNLAYAGVYAYRMRILTANGCDMKKIEESRKTAFGYIEKSFETLKNGGEISKYRKLFEYMKSVFINALSMNSENTPELLLRALEMNETISEVIECKEVVINRITILYYLCKLYSKKQFRDNGKIKEYGDTALEIADKAVAESPTVENLDIKMWVVYACAERLKEEYQYPLLEQAMDCAHRLYSTVRDEYYKKELAYAEAKYASSLGKAINSCSGVTTEDMHKCDEIWDHGFSLFEELISSGYNPDDISSYVSYLVTRGEIYCARGYYNKAYGFLKRAEELLENDIERCMKKAENAQTPDAGRYEEENISWCKGWLARANGSMAKIHLEQLNLKECIRYAKKGAKLSLERSARITAHYRRAVEYTLYEATASYYLRLDEEALEICDKLENLLSSPDAENKEVYFGEINYIRARIALERNNTDEAQQYFGKCISYGEHNAFYNDRLLILKADILTALNAPDAGREWRVAFERWKERSKEEKTRVEKDYEYKIYTKNGKSYRRIYRRECRSYAVASYYMAYSLYHCITDTESLYELAGIEEKTLCAILEMTGKGSLAKIHPPLLEKEKIEVIKEEIREPEIFEDADGFIKKLAEITADTNERDMSVFKLIEKNIRIIENGIPAKEQFELLSNTVSQLYDRLFKDNVAYNQAVEQTKLIRLAFPLGQELPVFYRDYSGYRVWDENKILSRCADHRSLMRLLMYLLRYEECEWNVKRKFLDNTMILYRCIAEMNGGERDISKADISIISTNELKELVSVFKMETELRIKSGFIYWYELKDIWCAELYERTKDASFIEFRISEFDEFLTEKYKKIYESYLISDKKDMPFEISHAAMKFIRTLASGGMYDMALKVAKWFESRSELRGNMMFSTIKLLKASDLEDERWINDLIMRRSECLADKARDGLWSLRMYT